jgi:small acid-soluble spore protein E (minor gamma-type SASP)
MNQQSGNKTSAGTDIEQVKKQNQQSATQKSTGSSQFGNEFGSDTDVREVKRQNQQSEENKNANK